MDLLPTFARLAGAKVPDDRILDGRDVWPLISGAPGAKSPHDVFYYYHMEHLQAVRWAKWKLHLPGKRRRGFPLRPEIDKAPMLFDVVADRGETRNVAGEHPDVVERILALADKARDDLGDGSRPGKNQRPAGMVESPKPQVLSGN
jgi:arylsulfatase A-like enzyme